MYGKKCGDSGKRTKSRLRKARKKAHRLFDSLWKSQGLYRMTRDEAYEWLSDRLCIKRTYCHFSLFDIETCDKVISMLEDMDL